jgi:hypothetical protein
VETRRAKKADSVSEATGLRRISMSLATGLLCLAVTGLGGCVSKSSTSDALVVNADFPEDRPDPNAPYPDFSQPLRAAMEQMSDAEASQMSRELSALKSRRVSGAISEADYWQRVKELENLARQHSAATISKIETQK